jgi:internalin A
VGNVKTLVQDIRELKDINQGYKRIDYNYDQLSGKFNLHNMKSKQFKIILGLLFVLSSCTSYYRYKLEDAKKNTRALDLSSSNLIVPPDDIFQFPELEDIDLSNNMNLNWDATFERLAKINNLKTLILNDNPNINLKQVIISLSNFKKLKHLSLTGNKITFLPEEIVNLSTLESIDLSKNEININDAIEKFLKLNNLLNIEMQVCSINKIPHTITNFKTLETLNFYGNYLDSLPDLSLLPHLQSIDIGGNRFNHIPISITKIKTRINFYAQSNQITNVPFEIGLMKYGTFNLSNNPLLIIERDKVKKLVKAHYKFY